jgi:hypothetical protein
VRGCNHVYVICSEIPFFFSGDTPAAVGMALARYSFRRLRRGTSPQTLPRNKNSTKQEQQMKVQSGEVPRAPPGGDGAGDTDLGARAPPPRRGVGRCVVLGRRGSAEADRWHVGAQQHPVKRPQRTDRAKVAWCTSTTFAGRPLDRQTKEEDR